MSRHASVSKKIRRKSITKTRPESKIRSEQFSVLEESVSKQLPLIPLNNRNLDVN